MTDTIRLTTVTRAEVRLLGAAVEALDTDEADGEAMHLLLGRGTRRWVVQGSVAELVADVDDPDVTGEIGWLPVSDRVRRFADATGGDVTLHLADDRTVLARAGSTQAAIDLVPGSARPDHWHFVATASASVPAGALLPLLWSARWMPSGVDDSVYPMPPMWLRLGDGRLTLHVDWSDFMPSRSTYHVEASSHRGEATVAIPHRLLETFLHAVPTVDDELDELTFTIEVGTIEVGTIEVGTNDADAIDADAIDVDSIDVGAIEIGDTTGDGEAHEAMRLSGPGWCLTTRTVNPLRARWALRVRDELALVDGDVTQASPVSWVIDVDGVDVAVHLHLGHPDVARVSALLVDDVDECLDLLRELGALNAASCGVRYWWEDGAVYAAADVRCTALDTLHDAVRDVADSAEQYAPMLAALGAQP